MTAFAAYPSVRRTLLTPSRAAAERSPHASSVLGMAALVLAAICAALPVAAQDATIESFRIASTPSGGSATDPVWIIDDPIVFEVRYSAALDDRANGVLELELDEFGDGRGTKRTADCRVSDADPATLVCTYVVQEGDEGTGVSVDARAGSLRGELPRAIIPTAGVTGSSADVDGIRVTIADAGVTVRILDSIGLDISHNGVAKAKDTVEVTLAFADGEEPYSQGFHVSLALDNATRRMTYVENGDGRPTFRYTIVQGDHDRRFRLVLAGTDHLTDRNGNRGLAANEEASSKFLRGSVREVDARRPRISSIRVRGLPQHGAYAEGDSIRFVVSFDEPYEMDGTPSLDVLVGGSAAPQSASCEQDTDDESDEMVCKLAVREGWEDRDGVATPANPLAFGKGTLTDMNGNAVENRFAAQSFEDHRVDAVAPTAEGVTVRARGSALRVGDTIDATVSFSEATRVITSRPNETSLKMYVEPLDEDEPLDFEFLRAHGNSLEFRYQFTNADSMQVGEAKKIEVSKLTAGGMVQDVYGNKRPFELPASVPSPVASINLATSASEDVTLPGIDAIVLHDAPRNGMYAKGDDIEIDVVFSEAVDSFDSGLRLGLTIGGKKESAEEPKAIGGGWVVRFQHSPSVSGAIAVTELEPPESTSSKNLIQDGSGNSYWQDENGMIRECHNFVFNKECPLGSLPTKSPFIGSATVDLDQPQVQSITFLPTPAPRATGMVDARKYYGEGETIAIEVAMTEKVTLESTPKLNLLIGNPSSPVPANFVELRQGTKLIFDYTVKADDTDRDGLEAISLDLRGVRDLAGNCVVHDLARNCIVDAAGYFPAVLSAAHRVDGSLSAEEDAAAETPPATDTPQTIRANASDGSERPPRYYTTGDDIVIEVDITPTVSFGRSPTLELDFSSGGDGCASLAADTTPGRNVSRLTYRCRIESGDEDLDGIGAMLIGRIETGDGVVAETVPARFGQPVRVDARAPVLEELAFDSRGPYKAAEQIIVEATFSEPVSAASGASMPLLVGGVTRSAPLRTTSTSRQLTFRYTTVAGDTDADGVSIPALTAARIGAAIVDAAGNEAVVDHRGIFGGSVQAVDTTPPEIESIRVTGTPRTYRTGERIVFEVAFTEAVRAATRTTLAVTIGGVRKELSSSRAEGNDRSLRFAYTVAEGDDGEVAVPADALAAPPTDATGNTAVALHGARSFDGVTVDATAPGLASTGALTVSSRPQQAGTYRIGEVIEVTAAFDESVVITGSPRLALTVGNATQRAHHVPGGDARTVRFRYTVQQGDLDRDGVSIPRDPIGLPDGTAIADAGGLAADIRHPGLAPQPGHKVDGVAPRVRGEPEITSRPAIADAYFGGETIALDIAFTEPVALGRTGASLELAIGAQRVDAQCRQAGDAVRLTCLYTVRDGDFDSDGIRVRANALSGTVTDLAGNAAQLGHGAVEDDPDHKVYAQPPEVVGSLDDLALVAGGEVQTVDLSGSFLGALVRLSAESSDAAVAGVAVAGATLGVRSGVEGRAEITVTATNPAGSASLTFAAVVSTDPNETAVLADALAAIGRGMLSSTTSVIGSRFEIAPGQIDGEALAIGGRNVTPQAMSGDFLDLNPDSRRHRAAADLHGRRMRDIGMGPRSLLRGSSFAMPLQASGGSTSASIGVWGAADVQRIEPVADEGLSDINATSAWLGVDARGDGWVLGTSISHSMAEVEYTFLGKVEGAATMETQLTGFHPYGRWDAGKATQIWLIGGLGSGEAELTRTHVDRMEAADLALAMVAGGLQRDLSLDLAGAKFTLKGDAGFLNLEADETTGAMAELAAAISRLRFGVEAAWEVGLAHPFVEVSGRFDGGDGATGGGVELAGGVRLLNLAGFGLEAKGRLLATHSAEGYRESGISVAASYDAGAPGRGITFRLSPRWGDAADGMDVFWSEAGAPAGFAEYAGQAMNRRGSWGVDSTLGYGFDVGALAGLVTPFGQMHLGGEDDVRRMRIGVRYGLASDAAHSARFEVFAERAHLGPNRAAENRVMLVGEARF